MFLNLPSVDRSLVRSKSRLRNSTSSSRPAQGTFRSVRSSKMFRRVISDIISEPRVEQLYQRGLWLGLLRFSVFRRPTPNALQLPVHYRGLSTSPPASSGCRSESQFHNANRVCGAECSSNPYPRSDPISDEMSGRECATSTAREGRKVGPRRSHHLQRLPGSDDRFGCLLILRD